MMDLDLDIEVLVGELPEIPCEEPCHDISPMHDGPATHYARWTHGCAFPPGTVMALCGPIVARLSAKIAAGYAVKCALCKRMMLLRDFVQILGPIKGGQS